MDDGSARLQRQRALKLLDGLGVLATLLGDPAQTVGHGGRVVDGSSPDVEQLRLPDPPLLEFQVGEPDQGRPVVATQFESVPEGRRRGFDVAASCSEHAQVVGPFERIGSQRVRPLVADQRRLQQAVGLVEAAQVAEGLGLIGGAGFLVDEQGVQVDSAGLDLPGQRRLEFGEVRVRDLRFGRGRGGFVRLGGATRDGHEQEGGRGRSKAHTQGSGRAVH